MGGDRKHVKDQLKYLGIILNGRLNFQAYFSNLVSRLESMAMYLGCSIPNIYGPGLKIRRFYANVIKSIVMYGAPVWTRHIKKKEIAILAKLQRFTTIRITRAYRTIPGELVLVLAGIIPFYQSTTIDYKVYQRAREQRSEGVVPSKNVIMQWREQERANVLSSWRAQLSSGRPFLSAITGECHH